MDIGVATERMEGETRVALVPTEIKKLVKQGARVRVQAGAGAGAYISDEEFAEAGATVVPDAAAVYAASDVVLRINTPTADEIAAMKPGTAVFGFLWPLQEHELTRQAAERGLTWVSMDMVPRITRAQSMDALSAMSSVSGYQAVLLAAGKLPKFCPMLMTAAGTIRPSKGMVLGAGVAGLMAIGTLRRLGAVVEANDVRPATKEQVESLGGKFVFFDAGNAEDAGGYAKDLTPEQKEQQKALLHRHISGADMVITTALIPGQPAPVLVTEQMVVDMKPGSVIIDLAAATGGNCPLTEKDAWVVKHGVHIYGPTNLPAQLPVHASQMYSKVVSRLLAEATDKDGGLNIDLSNDVLVGCVITHGGQVVQARVREALGLQAREVQA